MGGSHPGGGVGICWHEGGTSGVGVAVVVRSVWSVDVEGGEIGCHRGRRGYLHGLGVSCCYLQVSYLQYIQLWTVCWGINRRRDGGSFSG